MDVWDPIGVRDMGAPRDEYDAYIAAVYGLLTGGASDDEIAAELLKIEEELMGLSSSGLTVNQTVAALRKVELIEGS